MKLIVYFLILASSSVQAQHTISGNITDKKKFPIAGANVYLKGTYDGTTSNEDGSFEFQTHEQGSQTLVVSFVSFEQFERTITTGTTQDLEIELREDVSALDAVVLSAGTFSAGDNSKVSVLKPLDIVTTAGVAGDFIAALQTLPGTQTVGEDGRLFVRGGTAEETQIFIDGLRVFQPYTSTVNNLPARGRYSPFLFDGITFSTGGYSSEYGQALSSVLLLNTIKEPDQTKTDIFLMTVGAGLGHTQKWQKSSLSLNTSYINLAPYLELIPNNEQANFTKPFNNLSGEVVYRNQLDNGLLKFYTAYDHTGFAVLQPDINLQDPVRFNLKNNNLYSNISYQGNLGNGWSINPGIGISHSVNDITINAEEVLTKENAAHLKLKAGKRFNSRFRVNGGTEYILLDYSEDFQEAENGSFSSGFKSNLLSGFTEADLIFSKKFAVKVGLRGSYLQLNEKFKVSPRLSAAYKLSSNGQLSVAYGDFFQQARGNYLKYDQTLQPETASHYILNYQWTKPGFTFRAEAFHKDYAQLVKYDTTEPLFNSTYSNQGEGYARGIDLFYRDNKSISNFEYWASYSFIDSKRDYQNFPVKATPNFVATHSASLVTKYWIEGLRSQIGFTYMFSSGRPYVNPNTSGFLNERTGNYNNLSFNWAYLIDQQKILYFSVSNIAGHQNIFNYEYANRPDDIGHFKGRPITQASDRFFFVGFFWTISSDKTSNQLENL